MTIDRFVALLVPLCVQLACSDGATQRVHPEITVAPLDVDFGAVPAGGHASREVTVTASGPQPLIVQGLVFGAPAFSLAGPRTLPFDVATGAKEVVTLTFTAPSALGAHSTTLDVTSNADNSPKLTITLRGETVAGCVDECVVDAGRCLNGATAQRCGHYHADACLEWGADASCGAGGCVGDKCATCTDDCTAGQTRCLSLAVMQTCGNFDADSCLEWGGDAACSPAMCAGSKCGACGEGARRRCWVECGQTYPAGCLRGGVEPLLQGVERCVAGAWSDCTTTRTCTGFDVPCSNGAEVSTTYECLDGTTKTGAYGCTQMLGASCTTSYWAGWGPRHSGAELCNTAGEKCPTAGEKRDCVVHCNLATGPTQPGQESCSDFDGNVRVWGPCLTNDACQP